MLVYNQKNYKSHQFQFEYFYHCFDATFYYMFFVPYRTTKKEFKETLEQEDSNLPNARTKT